VRLFDEQQYQKFRSTCASLADLLHKSNHRTQQLSRGIMPVQLDAEGLRSAPQELSKSISASSRVDCQVECPKSLKIESNTVAT
jgi:hypothetical protein